MTGINCGHHCSTEQTRTDWNGTVYGMEFVCYRIHDCQTLHCALKCSSYRPRYCLNSKQSFLKCCIDKLCGHIYDSSLYGYIVQLLPLCQEPWFSMHLHCQKNKRQVVYRCSMHVRNCVISAYIYTVQLAYET